jgi:EAL domain-containing protein (putative c-di-GMP-specific phosphodiesterase class I)
LGFVSPADFIPLAEETGLIIPIGNWVLGTACAQFQRWLEAGLPLSYVGVNLSARQFRQPDLATSIRDVLMETGLQPRYLCIELTESLLMEDAEATVAVLYELRGIGIRALAIDDFGTGYSSLSYLQRFPVTEIKIDRSFVQDITTNPGNASIATSIIALAHSLGLQAVAEGVETEEQRVALEQAGCDRFQGYLASRPVAADDLAALVAGGRF